MKPPKIDWSEAIKPLLKKYKKIPHPLQSKNLYQQIAMVVLSVLIKSIPTFRYRIR